MNHLITQEPSFNKSLVDWSTFSVKDYLPSQKEAISLARKKIEAFKSIEIKSLKHLIEQETIIFDELAFVSNIFENQLHAHATDELNAIATEFSKNNVVFNSEFFSDLEIYQKMKDAKDSFYSAADKVEQRSFDKIMEDFIDRGVDKDEETRNKISQLDQELSELQIKFSDNIRKEKSRNFLSLSKEEMEGLPSRLVDYFKTLASQKEGEHEYVVGLDYPSVVGFLTHSPNRELKKKLYLMNSTLAQEGEFSNIDLAKSILIKRRERANLIGFKDHPSFILEKRMLNSSEKVMSFLQEIFDRSIKKSKNEIVQLKKYAVQELQIEDLQAYDMAYVLNKYKEQNLDFDEEQTRAYFPLPKVKQGLFDLVKKIFEIELTEDASIPVYHDEVKVYKVESKGKLLGHLYFDFFPRDTKSSGAWMAELIECGTYKGQELRPSICIVCNFSRGSEGNPALLSISEVETLFHEFGHALHGLCTQVPFKNIQGTRVTWDYVELPSQIMENWIFEDEVLELISEHIETKKNLPHDIVEKVKKSKNLFNGLATLRQSKFGHLDMEMHLRDINADSDLLEIEKEITSRFELLEALKGTSFFPTFSHIFAGGYSAGYYSYHWASVLEADAYESFKENGILDTNTGLKFKKFILESGDSLPPDELYRSFKGRDAKTEAFFNREEL